MQMRKQSDSMRTRWKFLRPWRKLQETKVKILKLKGLATSYFPKMLVNGYLEEKNLNFIVMPKYDIDLDKLYLQSKRRFKMETIINIGLKTIECLEVLHNCGLIHNDLKP